MNPFRGKTVLLQATYDRDWHFFEVISFLIIGVFGVTIIYYYYLLFIIIIIIN